MMVVEIVLCMLSLLLSLPAFLFLKNLPLYRKPVLNPEAVSDQAVSILIPARNEARGIRHTLEAALSTQHVTFEVVVLDDHSTDNTAEIVAEFQQRDPRVRLETSPELPDGWCGKQHACWVLSQRARYDQWLFLDADVRLTPDGVAAAVQFQRDSGAALISGVPRQETVSSLEILLIPLIHYVLLSFLPLGRMRQSMHPAYGAGCGQFFFTDRASYVRSGGHAAIRESLHDGVRLPRAYRQAGLMTDLFDATPAGVCRMYRDNGEVWRGLSKNATEGLASPAMIIPATVMLLGPVLLPIVGHLLFLGGFIHQWMGPVCALPVLLCLLQRIMAAQRFQQDRWSAWLHPFGIAIFLAIQWLAFFRKLCGQRARWKERSYQPQ